MLIPQHSAASISTTAAKEFTQEEAKQLVINSIIEDADNFMGALTGMPSRITLADARALIGRHTSSHTRLESILLLNGRMKRAELLTLLGENWSSCDYIFEYQREIRALFKDRYPIRELMNEEEQRYYDSLPDLVTCFRGADPRRIQGLCWSLNRDVANAFPFLQRYNSHPRPLLATGQVAKRDIIAVKLDRGEEEIISYRVRTTSTKRASKTRAAQYQRRAHGSRS